MKIINLIINIIKIIPMLWRTRDYKHWDINVFSSNNEQLTERVSKSIPLHVKRIAKNYEKTK